jgi:hypothetical protein
MDLASPAFTLISVSKLLYPECVTVNGILFLILPKNENSPFKISSGNDIICYRNCSVFAKNLPRLSPVLFIIAVAQVYQLF